jgi:uncharacterized membrane protein HdeD (DUF308 family)
MLKMFFMIISIIIGIAILSLGMALFAKTEYVLQKGVEIRGLSKESFAYKFITNKKNLIFYKICGILLVLSGIICLAIPILRGMN